MSASSRWLVVLLLLGDPLPAGAVARFGSERFRLAPAQSLAWLSPDARQIAVWAGSSSRLDLLDATTGRLIRSNQFPRGRRWEGFAVVPAGDRVAIRFDGTLCVCAATTGKPLWRIQRPEFSRCVLAFDPTGKFLAAVDRREEPPGETPAFRLYRADTGKETASLRLPNMQDVGLAVSPDGKRLLTWGEPSADRATSPQREYQSTSIVQLWDLGIGRELRRTTAVGGWVGRGFTRPEMVDAAFRPDGKELALAIGSSIHLWAPASGARRRAVRASGTIQRVRYSPDGRLLIAVTERGRMDVWNARTGQRQPMRPGPNCFPNLLAFPAPGRIVACGRAGQQLVLWDAVTGKVLRSGSGHRGAVSSVRFAGPRRLLTASMDGEIITWDLSGREVRHSSLERTAGVMGLKLSPGGRWVTGWSGRTRVVHDRNTGERVLGRLDRVYGREFDPRISRDDATLVFSVVQRREDRHTYLVKPVLLGTGEELPAIDLGPDNDLADLAVSPDGRTVAVTTERDDRRFTVRLYQTATGKALPHCLSFSQPGRSGSILEFSPDGQTLLVSDSDDSCLSLLDSQSGACLHRVRLLAAWCCRCARSSCWSASAMQRRGRRWATWPGDTAERG
jgi:WD40 repeat protein